MAAAKYDAAVWPARLEGKELMHALKAVHACLDALWAPLLDEAEAQLGSAGARPSWDSLTPAALVSLLRDCSGTAGAARWENAEACAALLAMLSASWEARLGLGHSVSAAITPESAWENRSACRLLSLLSLALCKTVAVEDERSFGLRLDAWRVAERAFGLARPALCAAVDAAGKATLLYADVCAIADIKLRLECERPSALWETRAQWEASAQRVGAGSPRGLGSGSVKLFPQFRSTGGGVEHGDGHGPRKEFFVLVGEQMLQGQRAPHSPASFPAKGDGGQPKLVPPPGPPGAPPPVFPYSRGARQHWFDPNLPPSEDSRSLLRYCGWLLAQAVCNRSPLNVTLPSLLFESLLASAAARPSLASLAAFDPQASASLQAVSKMGPNEYAELAELEECVGTPKEEYVAMAVERIVGGGDAGWQLAELRAGFAAVLPAAVLGPLRFSAAQLAAAVCGGRASDADFSIREVFRVVEDDELLACAPLREALWAVLDSWPAAEKRALLKFCTASEIPPAPGTEVLSVQMPFTPIGSAEAAAMAQMLPQAHTCDNILELPNYHQALLAHGTQAAALPRLLRATIQDRFMIALHSCDGYGLDEVGSAGEPRPARVKPPAADLPSPQPHRSAPGGAVALSGVGSSQREEVEVLLLGPADSADSIDALLAGMQDVQQETAGAAVLLELDSLRSEPQGSKDNGAAAAPPGATRRKREKRNKKEKGQRPAEPAIVHAIVPIDSDVGSSIAVAMGSGGGGETADFLRELEIEVAGGEAATAVAPETVTRSWQRGPAAEGSDVDAEALQALEDELEAM